MADVFSKRKRSEVMSRIRSRGNKDTELALAKIFRAQRITGWRRHASVFGRPDFIFPKVVVVPFFIADGLQSYADISVVLGFEEQTGKAASRQEVLRRNPYHLRGKTLYYASAIGTARLMADLILDRVVDFNPAKPLL
jgi:sirohydrochlorin ferrochelatase